MNRTGTQRFVVSVLVSDRVGILRDITAAVENAAGSIEGISQTVVEGYFTVILTAAFPVGTSEQIIRAALEQKFSSAEAAIAVRPHVRSDEELKKIPREQYVLTISAPGESDILKPVTAFLAEKDINIEDWFMIYDDTGLTHVGEVSVPVRLDIKQVQDDFHAMLATSNATVSFQHENIFRATTEIGPVRPMLQESTHHA